MNLKGKWPFRRNERSGRPKLERKLGVNLQRPTNDKTCGPCSLLREQGDAESVRHGSEVLVAQSYLTLCNPIDWGSPGSAVHGLLQGRVLEWAASGMNIN